MSTTHTPRRKTHRQTRLGRSIGIAAVVTGLMVVVVQVTGSSFADRSLPLKLILGLGAISTFLFVIFTRYSRPWHLSKELIKMVIITWISTLLLVLILEALPPTPGSIPAMEVTE